MQSIDPTSLARKILDLIKAEPGTEIELSLLRNGSCLVEKAQED